MFSVIDCFDALTSDQPYRPAVSKSDMRQSIRDERGQHFDPQIVDLFFACFPDNS